tara:strand:+ start:339 stop:551 length:213 start_codon:yes stop_codon:yes gene_type:complete
MDQNNWSFANIQNYSLWKDLTIETSPVKPAIGGSHLVSLIFTRSGLKFLTIMLKISYEYFSIVKQEKLIE